MMISLAGKVALVAGAGGGIGTAVVRTLSAVGAAVIGVDLPGREIPAAHRVLACDLTDRAAIDRMAQELAGQYEQIDILVHCAGVTRDGVFWKLNDSDWETVMHVNLDSAFYLLRGTAPLLRRAKT